MWIQVSRVVALLGYFGLWLLLPLWYGWIHPPQLVSLPMVLGILMFPLIFPLKGLVTGNRYTYTWGSLVALIYFAHGVLEAYTEQQLRGIAAVEIFLSMMFFSGAVMYVKLLHRQSD